MYIFIILSAVFISEGAKAELIRKNCSDCVPYTECPEAQELILHKRDETNEQLFMRAFCGIGQSKSELKVCCSIFQQKTGVETPGNDILNSEKLSLLPSNCGSIFPSRLLTNHIVELYEFPWMALISYFTADGLQFQCTGSIINSRYVLTAARCVIDRKIAGVRVGEYDLTTATDCQGNTCEDHIQDIPVESSVVHVGYQKSLPAVNDIALLRLATPIDFEYKNVKPICLPKTAALLGESLDNKIAQTAGWGLTNMDSSTVMMRSIVTIQQSDSCRNSTNKVIQSGSNLHFHQLCARMQREGDYNSDPGSPLMVEGLYDNVMRNIQYGIQSFVPWAGMPGDSFIYTDITKFMSWILDNINP